MAPARRDLPVPMRDGTLLRADLWLPDPEIHPGPRPALICRTPYGKGRDAGELRFAERAAGRGYAVLLQDVRGRYASEGVFQPHVDEGRDGHATIEWAASQAWCDGRVGTFGLSYPGCAQWLAALERPPHLKAMAPAMSYARLVDCVYYGGVFDGDWLRWGVVSMAPDERARRGLAGPQNEPEAWEDWQARPEAAREGFLPLADLPDLDITPYVRRWLTTPPASPWWNFADMTGRYQDIGCAVLHLDGWLDDAYGPKGAIANHLGLCAARQGDNDARSQLVLGPWAHGIAAVDGRERHGTRDLGPGAYIDYDGLVLDFMDRHVRGLETSPRPAAPVRSFVMGSNRWLDVPSWPPPATEQAFFLHVPGQGSPLGALLAAPPAAHGSASFVNDPKGPLREPPDRAMGAHDLRDLLDLAGDRLAAWESAPLTEDLTVAGNIRAELFLSLDAPDADIFVKILDVAPDGTAYPLMNARAEVLRLSHRDGQRDGHHDGHHDGRAPQPLEPGRVYPIVIDTLLTANTFLVGHRIRVIVCASWFPALSRNLQTGQSEAFTSASRPATVTIHCGPGRESRVVLPTLQTS